MAFRMMLLAVLELGDKKIGTEETNATGMALICSRIRAEAGLDALRQMLREIIAIEDPANDG